MITQQRLKQLLKYNPKSGEFHWLVNRTGSVRAGSLAGCIHSDGYRAIKIDGKKYYSQRLAWLYQTGSFHDHLLGHGNQNNSDNRWDNLLELSQIYSPISYKKARVAMLNTRIGKLQMLKEQAVLDVQKLDSAWSPG